MSLTDLTLTKIFVSFYGKNNVKVGLQINLKKLHDFQSLNTVFLHYLVPLISCFRKTKLGISTQGILSW